MEQMPSRAAVVIVGGGIVGASVAYHLAQLGQTDILVLDQGAMPENPGSTSHAPGGVVAMSHDRLLARLSFYSTDLYRRLERFDQFRHTYNPVGSIELALSAERMADLVRLHGEALAYGSTTELLDAAGVAARVPYLDQAQLAGGLFIPDSAIVSGAGITGALLRDSKATVLAHTRVVEVVTEDGRTRGVLTDQGERIEADQVVLCTNIWPLPMPDGAGLPLPLMAFEHQYVITTPVLEGFDPDSPDDEIVHPTVRDMDSALYFRHHWNQIGVGSYQHSPLAVSPGDVGETADRPFTPQHFGEAWKAAQRVIPDLADVDRFTTSFNGMFAFTVDGMPIIGETAVPGLWMSVGAWITHAGGVGKATAELMVAGESEWDLRQASIDRFLPYATTGPYIQAVTAKNYREVYEIHHPREPTSDPRGVRLSPFAPRLAQFRPHTVPFAGIELAAWYEANEALLPRYADRLPTRSEWASRHWSPIAGAEHLACREQAALFDLTGLSIIDVTGPEAAAYVDHLCSNRMDVAPGRVVYTTWLTLTAGLKRDLTVARLGPGRYWMFVGEGTRPQDLAWARRHAAGYDVTVADISDAYTALGLWGPHAQEILTQVTDEDVTPDALRYFRGRWIDIGPAPVYAMRISYVGEAGWELHIPIDQALGVLDRIWEAGSGNGLVLAGSTAMDSLRIEKGYRLWGADIHTEYNPYEAGLGWTVRLDHLGFVGAERCSALEATGPARKLSCLLLDSGDPLGNEAVLDGAGAVGYITSAAYGHSVEAAVAYTYLPLAIASPGSRVDVLIEGVRHHARVAEEPLWDPDGKRLR